MFKEIVFWLSSAHAAGIHLNGIVYLHSIAAPRWAASCAKSSAMLKSLCGPENYASVVLATTHWSSVSDEIGNQRHQELSQSQDMWAPLREAGAVVCYHSAGKASALRIVKHLMKLPKCTLAIQKEMDGPNKKLSDTDAGKQIIALWGEELSANEEEIQQQMEAQLLDHDNERTENIAELRQSVATQQSFVTQTQITRKQLHEEWQARNDQQLQIIRQEIEANKQKIEEGQRQKKESARAHQRNRDLELLKIRSEELNRLEMTKLAARRLDISKKQMYLDGLTTALSVAANVAPLAAACVVM